MDDLLKRIDQLHTQIKAQRPLSAQSLASLKTYYNLGLTWSSNALEGNTLTESETKVVIEDGLTVAGKPLRDHFEAVGHAEAFEFMMSLTHSSDLTEAQISNLHRLFFIKIDAQQAGRYRNCEVLISGSRFPVPKPEKVPKLMQHFVSQLSASRPTLHPVIFAARAHKEFVFIHPFIDGNGRVARLIMNLCLIQAGFPIAIIPPIRRADYIARLEKAHTNDTEFVTLIEESVLDGLKDYVRMMGIV